MAIKEEIGFGQFCDRFRDMDRQNHFSYQGKKALFDYLEELSEDIEEDIELDVIGLCCEYSEYSDEDEFFSEYLTAEEAQTLRDQAEENDHTIYEEIMDYLSERTMIVTCEEGCILFQSY